MLIFWASGGAKPQVVSKASFCLDVDPEADAAAFREQAAAFLGMDVGEVWLERSEFRDLPEDTPVGEFCNSGDIVTVYRRQPMQLSVSLFQRPDVNATLELYSSNNMGDVVRAFQGAVGDAVADVDETDLQIFRLNDDVGGDDHGGDVLEDGSGEAPVATAIDHADMTLTHLMDVLRRQGYLPHSRLVGEGFVATDQLVVVKTHRVEVKIQIARATLAAADIDPLDDDELEDVAGADYVVLTTSFSNRARFADVGALVSTHTSSSKYKMVFGVVEGVADADINLRAFVGDLAGPGATQLVVSMEVPAADAGDGADPDGSGVFVKTLTGKTIEFDPMSEMWTVEGMPHFFFFLCVFCVICVCRVVVRGCIVGTAVWWTCTALMHCVGMN